MEPAAPATRAALGTLDRSFELTSVLPLSAFALLHVASYGRVLLGVGELGARASPPLLLRIFEVLLVWAPLGFHVALAPGVYARRRQERLADPSERASLMVHRLAGPLLLAFLADHFVRFRWPIVRGERYPSDALGALAAELSRTTSGLPLVAAFHALGTFALAFHLGFGLWRVAARYPRHVSPRTARWVSAGLGIVTALVGTLTIVRLAAG